MRRPQPNRNRAAAPRAPFLPLGEIAAALRLPAGSEGAKPDRRARAEVWRQSDKIQGERPDYLLWRHTLCRECPPEKRRGAVEMALNALRANDPQIQWASVALVCAALLQKGGRLELGDEEMVKVRTALEARLASINPAPPHSPHSTALVRWWADVSLGRGKNSVDQLQAVIAGMNPGWRLGRPFSLALQNAEQLLPIRPGLVASTTAKCLRAVLVDEPACADWKLVVWQLLGSSRRPGQLPGEEEVLALLDAAQSTRLAGDGVQSSRLLALVLQLVPALVRPSPVAVQRFKAAVWTLAEAGLEMPESYRVSLDELPFPGDPPSTLAGQEAALLFADAADVSLAPLLGEVNKDSGWKQIAEAGQALHHPLAALAWMGKRAQSIAMKKSPAVLETATRLGLRHGCLGSVGRLIQECPSSELMLDYAKAMRESIRRMPLLRDAEAWPQWTALLRQVWGKLEASEVTDAESLFLLHETLADRPTTAVRSLPQDLRMLTLRHPFGRRPSRLTLALTEDPSLMRSLEHQRALEHWSLASDARTRPELAKTAWISVVTRGEPAAGKYSLLAIGPVGQVSRCDRLTLAKSDTEETRQAMLAKVIAQAADEVAPEAEWLLIAQDYTLSGMHWPALLRAAGLRAVPVLIPSWEWASRVLIKAAAEKSDVAPEVLTSGESVQSSAEVDAFTERHSSACVLFSEAAVSAATKWAAGSVQRRSTHIGLHPLVVATAPCGDLVRSCLAQSTLLFVDARVPLSDSSALLTAALSSVSLHRALLEDPRLADVTLHGIPWLAMSTPISSPPPPMR
jgi:hypothetical protein